MSALLAKEAKIYIEESANTFVEAFHCTSIEIGSSASEIDTTHLGSGNRSIAFDLPDYNVSASILINSGANTTSNLVAVMTAISTGYQNTATYRVSPASTSAANVHFQGDWFVTGSLSASGISAPLTGSLTMRPSGNVAVSLS